MSSYRQLIECISRLQVAGTLNTPELIKIKTDLLKISQNMQSEEQELQKYRYLASDHPVLPSKPVSVSPTSEYLETEEARRRLERWYG
jgi:hypothetical protein